MASQFAAVNGQGSAEHRSGLDAKSPPPYGLEPNEDRSEPTLAPHALRGEVLCAAWHSQPGASDWYRIPLRELDASLAREPPQTVSRCPLRARRSVR